MARLSELIGSVDCGDGYHRRPATALAVFWAFMMIGVQAFGGALAIAQREMIDRRRWFTKEEFLELLTVSQALPGPNVAVLGVMVGDQFHGVKGAVAGGAGIVALPLAVLTGLILAYQGAAGIPEVQGALRGIAAVAAGMIAGSAMNLLSSARKSPVPLPLWAGVCAVTFAAVALLRVPL
ncbi:MAG: chromate transporter, partial [Duodenibacillus sp.]|nr:chromate transporter [Duodenibacillus sp.]